MTCERMVKVKLDEGAIMPTRAHPYDAGLDLYTPVDVLIPATETLVEDSPFGFGSLKTMTKVGSATIDTGIHIEIPEGYVGFLKSKSGLNVIHSLTADGGVIDAHYTGSIAVKLYNHTYKPYRFKAGDKIAQLVIVPCLLPELELVDSLEETDRGDAGFGSTGR